MKILRVVPCAIVLLATAVVYGGFLYSPIVFDDGRFFITGVSENYLALSSLIRPRDLAYATLALNWKLLGSGLLALRLASLVLHALVGVAIYYFVRQIRLTTSQQNPNAIHVTALFAALIFVAHPAAVYAAGYLIQRTIVMATLFSVLSWCFVLRGLESKKGRWFWLGAAAYALAILSKEHAVMVPAVSAVLVIWWHRTHSTGLWRDCIRRLLPAFVAQGIIAALLVLHTRGVIGTVYEISAQEMLESVSVTHAWPMSAMTQSLLFFKYLLLWLVPNPMWMSADMREPFANSFLSGPHLAGTAAFLVWPILSTWLLWKGGRRGLVGFAMLAPWLLFLTELTAVRIQEAFVLYRSYLWIAPTLALAATLNEATHRKTLLVLTAVVPLILASMAWNRLTTFSHSLLLWDDAASLVEGREGLTGLERIYRNRGIELARIKKYDLAIEDYTKAIGYNARYSYAYNDRGAALLELRRYSESIQDFDVAIRLRPDYPNSHVGRGRALEALNRIDEAKQSYAVGCSLGWASACSQERLLSGP